MATKFTSKWLKNSPETAKYSGAESDKSTSGTFGTPIARQSPRKNASSPADEKAALLDRLRSGSQWLADQHERWLADDTTADNDAAFSKAYAGWFDLEFQFRAKYGLAGCIFGPEGKCSEDFGCIGCVTAPPVEHTAGIMSQTPFAN